MQIREAIADMGIGLASGFVGTKLLEPVSMKLYEWEPDEARNQEVSVRPGPPFQFAADTAIERLGLDVSESQRKTLGSAFHYGLGMS